MTKFCFSVVTVQRLLRVLTWNLHGNKKNSLNDDKMASEFPNVGQLLTLLVQMVELSID